VVVVLILEMTASTAIEMRSVAGAVIAVSAGPARDLARDSVCLAVIIAMTGVLVLPAVVAVAVARATSEAFVEQGPEHV
jgi:hypothetical protein